MLKTLPVTHNNIIFTISGKNSTSIPDPVPYSGVIVHLVKDGSSFTSTISDSEGVCTISDVPDGTYTLNCTVDEDSRIIIDKGINKPTINIIVDDNHKSFDLLLWNPSDD